jgi:hypothetical protein
MACTHGKFLDELEPDHPGSNRLGESLSQVFVRAKLFFLECLRERGVVATEPLGDVAWPLGKPFLVPVARKVRRLDGGEESADVVLGSE